MTQPSNPSVWTTSWFSAKPTSSISCANSPNLGITQCALIKGKENRPLALDQTLPEPQPLAAAKQIVCEERLGGLLKHYHHQAAA